MILAMCCSRGSVGVGPFGGPEGGPAPAARVRLPGSEAVLSPVGVEAVRSVQRAIVGEAGATPDAASCLPSARPEAGTMPPRDNSPTEGQALLPFGRPTP